jgi:hypothetical protein
MQNSTELDRDGKLNSYLAAQKFVRKMQVQSNYGETTCRIEIDRHLTTNNLEITHIDHIPAYHFGCDVFYSFGIKRTVWTNYCDFKWDSTEECLIANYDGKEIFFLTN